MQDELLENIKNVQIEGEITEEMEDIKHDEKVIIWRD